MNHRYFLTGTDTDAGKTLVSRLLLLRAKQHNISCFGLKPIAAGCTVNNGQLQNDDAIFLRRASHPSCDYALHNPIALECAIAPHIAAERAQETLTVADTEIACRNSLNQERSIFLVEGAGGWMVPLNKEETLADFAHVLGYPVILVVGMKLGCINHAILSAQAIMTSGLSLAGWVANSIDPNMQAFEHNLDYLKTWFTKNCVPHLGTVPHLGNLDDSNDDSLLSITSTCCWPHEISARAKG